MCCITERFNEPMATWMNWSKKKNPQGVGWFHQLYFWIYHFSPNFRSICSESLGKYMRYSFLTKEGLRSLWNRNLLLFSTRRTSRQFPTAYILNQARATYTYKLGNCICDRNASRHAWHWGKWCCRPPKCIKAEAVSMTHYVRLLKPHKARQSDLRIASRTTGKIYAPRLDDSPIHTWRGGDLIRLRLWLKVTDRY